ncbi:MarR family winged helix-turn-helix transcriptional regulator [Peribacillus simplex]|uniref:MarR family winged helix-turn-helix transcriptional regulator n=1 Tax=Peribacillus simplex TaxID=1478 RepID=UPI0038307292
MNNKQEELIKSWLSFTQFHDTVSKELEHFLQQKYKLALKAFYVLLFLAETPEKQLPLQELQNMIGLSQSAMSRLAVRMESKSCGVIRRHGYGDDRRGVYTTMTKKGEQFFEEVLESFEEELKRRVKIVTLKLI